MAVEVVDSIVLLLAGDAEDDGVGVEALDLVIDLLGGDGVELLELAIHVCCIPCCW